MCSCRLDTFDFSPRIFLTELESNADMKLQDSTLTVANTALLPSYPPQGVSRPAHLRMFSSSELLLDRRKWRRRRIAIGIWLRTATRALDPAGSCDRVVIGPVRLRGVLFSCTAATPRVPGRPRRSLRSEYSRRAFYAWLLAVFLLTATVTIFEPRCNLAALNTGSRQRLHGGSGYAGTFGLPIHME